MKYTPEQVSDRQSGHYKNSHIHEPFRRPLQMGDYPTNSNFNCCDRASDFVSCWGDVPKRPTRLADLLDENESEIMIPKAPKAMTERKIASDSHSPVTSDETKAASVDTITTTHKDKSHNKTTATAGRERLLEWLRTSQAKRDENNRQVLTKWIAKMESMNAQAMAVSNYNHSNFPAMDTITPLEYQAATVYSFNPTLPAPVTTPTLWLGNPMGLLTPNGGMNFRFPPASPPTNLHNIYLSQQASTKTLPCSGPIFPQSLFHPFVLPHSPMKVDICGGNGTSEAQPGYVPEANTQPDLLPQNRLLHPCDDDLKQCSEKLTKLAPNPNSQMGGGLGNPETQYITKDGSGNCLTSIFPPNVAESNLLRGGYHPQPMYVTTSSTYETTTPPLLYYYYLPTTGQHPMTYGLPSPSLTKLQGSTQPLIYWINPNGSYPSQCASDGSNDFGHIIHSTESEMVERDSPTLQQPEAPPDQANDKYGAMLNHTDELCGKKNCFPVTDTARQSTARFDQLTSDESIDLQMFTPAQTTVKFDFHKWYSMLNDITQVSKKTE